MRIRPFALAFTLVLLVPLQAAAAGRDSDHDGLPDKWEKINRTNPKKADSKADPDFDELTNIREYKERTRPQNYDTDSDFLPDGTEVLDLQSNPLKRDTDHDGLDDSPEADRTFDTDINDADSDDDGVLDGDEDADGDGTANEDEDDGANCLPGAHRDRDEDAVDNEDENEQGTDERFPDSDEDGELDGKEDADGDGVLNEDEDDVDPADCIARTPMEETLKDAATAEESFLTAHPAYTQNLEDLYNEGLRPQEDVELTIPRAEGNVGYCIEARHEEAELVLHYSSDEGRPNDGTC